MTMTNPKPFRWHTLLFVGALAVLLLLLAAVVPSGDEARDTTVDWTESEAPFFLVMTNDGKGEQGSTFTPATDSLPLLSTNVSIQVAGVIADVTVWQHYKNDGKVPIEAIYVFPGSTRAAVHHMEMHIGQRTLTAEVRKKEEARKIYEDAIAAGRTASLLEEERPNIFQMNVGNILPGDDILVKLSYVEDLVPEEGVYELVYPTVVGPRYGSSSTVDPIYTAIPTFSFYLEANIAAGLPIKSLTTPSHSTIVSFYNPSQTKASVVLSPGQFLTGNKDFIMRFELWGEEIQSGILLRSTEDESEKYFMAIIQPPQQVQTDDIPPREYIFIVDVSGSMLGFPIDVAKNLLTQLLKSLRPIDRFNILFFAGGSELLSSKSLPCNAKNIRLGLRLLSKQKGTGGTELEQAMSLAFSLPYSEGFARSNVLITDGFVWADDRVIGMVRDNLKESNLFAFGIGSSVNRHFIEGIAKAGLGEPLIITSNDEVQDKLNKFRRYIAQPVLTNVQLNFEDIDVYDVEPRSIPSLLAQRPIIVSGKYRGAVNSTSSVMVTGFTGSKSGSPSKWSSEVMSFASSQSVGDSSVLRYLWARRRLDLLEINLSEYQPMKDGLAYDEICAIGLQHHLLTRCTSFVAVDHLLRNENGTTIAVDVPLPLPEGDVSDVGDVGEGSALSTPVLSWLIVLLFSLLLLL